MGRELSFLFAVWKTNLLSAMEYRVAFITQVVGMMLNNAMYFVFWVVFFHRFEEVHGWVLSDMFLVFGVVAAGFGLAAFFFGNTFALAEIIINGRLDYFMALPRPVLLHTLVSRSVLSGIGDALYGVLSFLVAGSLSLESGARFLLGVLISMTIFLSFLVLVQSLAFWMGSATLLTTQATNAIITFAIYPITIFDGTARLVLFTLVPAALVGAVPAEFVRSFSWNNLGIMLGGALVFLGLALALFYRGLRRYESGSAIQVQV
jgi:ABC-2 type transport system permease protein